MTLGSFFISFYYASIIYLQAFLYSKMINSPYLIGKNHTLLRIKLGSMYLFDNYLVTEFNEGVVINHDNFREVAEIINKQFNNKR